MTRIARDQINAHEWRKVTALAWAVARARTDGTRAAKAKCLLTFLDELDTKYGESVDVLATRAEYVSSARSRVWLLRRAYRLASRLRDRHNLMLIACSLAEHYAEQNGMGREARRWLGVLKEHLRRNPDEYGIRWARELEEQLK